MASKVQIKRSAVEGKIPGVADLELGELAVNTYDGKLFLKTYNGIAYTIKSIGEDQGFDVKNQTGSTIPKGTVLRFAGTLGASGKLLAAPFLANGTYPSKYVIGVAKEDIANGSEGFAVSQGKIFNFNTASYPDGTILYASSTTTGGYSATMPAAPNNKVTIAAVVHSSTSSGVLEVRVTYGSQLGEDELVQLGTLADNDLILYKASASRFENVTPSFVHGVVTLPVVETITTGSKNIDLSLADNFHFTLQSNVTFTVSNLSQKIGRSGNIILKQDATGGRTFTKASEMKTPIGGAAIDQWTAANSLSVISYYVVDANTLIINYIGNFA